MVTTLIGKVLVPIYMGNKLGGKEVVPLSVGTTIGGLALGGGLIEHL